MRVAIVHDWLVAPDGAEKVLEQLVQCYPEADLFSLVDFLADPRVLYDKSVTTSFIQRLPFARRHYRAYSRLFPLAAGRFDLSGYDLIITTSDRVASGVRAGPAQTHVSYMYSPTLHAWDRQQDYLREKDLTQGAKSWVARVALHARRLSHADSTSGIDRLIVNSRFAARRIMKTYRREAAVIVPPVDVNAFSVCARKEDFYVTASQGVPHRLGLIVDAFNAAPERKLVVIGGGPEMAALRAKAGANVTFSGDVSPGMLEHYLQRASAFVFASEDFDARPLQAQACGTPVIAFGKGMALETVVPLGDAKPSGVYFGQQTIEAINAAIDRFERNRTQITPAACRANAERFSPAVFRRAFMAEMTRMIAASSLRAAAARRVESEAETNDANDANSTLRRPVEPAHKSITRH